MTNCVGYDKVPFYERNTEICEKCLQSIWADDYNMKQAEMEKYDGVEIRKYLPISWKIVLPHSSVQRCNEYHEAADSKTPKISVSVNRLTNFMFC